MHPGAPGTDADDDPWDGEEQEAGGEADGEGGDSGESAMGPLDLDCPTCGDVQEHEVLRAAAAGWTVACSVCGAVRTLPSPRQQRFVAVPVILSEGSTSRTAQVQVPLDGKVAVDDEFDLEGHRIRVTAVEVAEGRRPNASRGREVKTLYAVLFDTVTLHYTVNQGEVTRSFQEEVVPETEVHVGTVREVQGVRLAVKTLKSDQNRTLHRGFLLARNVRRVFADVAHAKARPGAKVKTRQRGAGPWGTQGKRPSNKDKRPRGTGPRRS